MGNSTRTHGAAKAAQRKRDFPLFKHATGRWTKKVRGKFHYFGKIVDDPQGQAALLKWLDQRDELLAGRTPRPTREGLTVAGLCNRFLGAKELQRDSGDLAGVTLADYVRTCKVLVDAFGRDRLVDDLATDDFESLRASLAKQYGVHRLGNTVKRVRSVFKYGYDAGLLEKPMRFGPTFKQPTARNRRLHRQKNGQRMFEAEEIRRLLDAAGQPLKAMIMLGINCGFGNNDCGTLLRSALNMKNGWIDHPRPKTAVERRCPLWRETMDAVREASACRPAPKSSEHAELVFITKYGSPWASEPEVVVTRDGRDEPVTKIIGEDSPITKEFRKLIAAIDAAEVKAAKLRREPAPAKLHSRGRSFYALRHTFETIAGESRDQVGVDFLMGHADYSMAGVYRERISDERLAAVTKHVHDWLFPQTTRG